MNCAGKDKALDHLVDRFDDPAIGLTIFEKFCLDTLSFQRFLEDASLKNAGDAFTRLKPRWHAFIAAHRDALRAGTNSPWESLFSLRISSRRASLCNSPMTQYGRKPSFYIKESNVRHG